MEIKELEITEVQQRILVNLLAQYIPNITVWAFGSRVRLTTRANSDLDLVVFAPQNMHLQIAYLKDALDESDLPFRVDLLIWDEIPSEFKKNIEARYTVIQSTKEQ